MRILILSWKDPLHPSAGGAERYLVEVAKRWVAADEQVTILGPRRGELQSQGAGAADNGVPYVGVGSKWTVFREAHRYLRSHGDRFDRVLESVSTRPFAAHRLVGRRAVALYMQTAEEVWTMEYRFPIGLIGRTVLEPSWIRKLVGARVVALSASTVAALARRGVYVEAVVPPGCEPPEVRKHRAAPTNAPRLLWMGRMVRTKRPADAIAAYRKVREALPGATLDLVGGGYLEKPIRAALHPGVTVHGFVPEHLKTLLLSRADLFVLPGTREGWGIVAMEAASHGVPVVAYDIPGLRDSVLDGVTGVLVAANADALGSASTTLLQQPERWQLLSVAAQQRAREFTWEKSARQLLLVLRHPVTTTDGIGGPEKGSAASR